MSRVNTVLKCEINQMGLKFSSYLKETNSTSPLHKGQSDIVVYGDHPFQYENHKRCSVWTNKKEGLFLCTNMGSKAIVDAQ